MTLKNIQKAVSKVPEKTEGLSGIFAQLSNRRNLVKGLLLAGSIASTGCALGYKEITVVSEQCHSMETCQNSLVTIDEKGVKPDLRLDWLKMYGGRLSQSIDTIESEVLKNMSEYGNSLEKIENYKAPNWAERLQKNPDEEALLILRQEALGILENLADENWIWQHKLSPSGADAFKLLARSSLDLTNLKLDLLAAKAKNPWLGGAEAKGLKNLSDGGLEKELFGKMDAGAHDNPMHNAEGKTDGGLDSDAGVVNPAIPDAGIDAGK